MSELFGERAELGVALRRFLALLLAKVRGDDHPECAEAACSMVEITCAAGTTITVRSTGSGIIGATLYALWPEDFALASRVTR